MPPVFDSAFGEDAVARERAAHGHARPAGAGRPVSRGPRRRRPRLRISASASGRVPCWLPMWVLASSTAARPRGGEPVAGGGDRRPRARALIALPERGSKAM
eukprot:6709612-Alexandrium_andersonii.AAC.1